MSSDDFTQTAIERFESFCIERELSFSRDADESSGFVAITIPPQSGTPIRHAICVGIQNGDELNLGVEEFWSHLFPYPDVIEEVLATLGAILDGRGRLRILLRGARRTRTELQIRSEKGWQTWYKHFHGMSLCFWTKARADILVI